VQLCSFYLIVFFKSKVNEVQILGFQEKPKKWLQVLQDFDQVISSKSSSIHIEIHYDFHYESHDSFLNCKK